MLIQINTDATLTSHEDRREEIKAVVTNALEHFSERISRVEVHLTREDGHPHVKHQLRCVIEARVEGRPPQAVTHHSDSMHEAVDAASEKLLRALEHSLGRAESRDRESVRHHEVK